MTPSLTGTKVESAKGTLTYSAYADMRFQHGTRTTPCFAGEIACRRVMVIADMDSVPDLQDALAEC